jgi:hypothetical protein
MEKDFVDFVWQSSKPKACRVILSEVDATQERPLSRRIPTDTSTLSLQLRPLLRVLRRIDAVANFLDESAQFLAVVFAGRLFR